MSDLVERLQAASAAKPEGISPGDWREYRATYPTLPILLTEAAAEITRLRSLLGEVRDRLDVIATADVYGSDKEGLQDLIVDIRCSARALIARIGEVSDGKE